MKSVYNIFHSFIIMALNRQSYGSVYVTVTAVLAPILREAFEQGAINEYVKANLNYSALESCDGVMKNLVRQVSFKPKSSEIQEDYEPMALGEDNMMQVTTLDIQPPKDHLKVTSIQNRSKKHGSKISMLSQSQTSEYKTEKKLRPPPKDSSQLVPSGRHQPVQQEKDIVKIYRFKKQEQERQRLLPPVVKAKNTVPRLGKGQMMLFDFEGNIGKVKEMKSPAFQTVVVDSQLQPKTKITEKQGMLTDEFRNMQVMLVNRLTDKLGSKRSGRMFSESEHIDFTKAMDQKQLSSLIKIQTGIKMTIGNEVLQGQKLDKEVLPRGWTSVQKKIQLPREKKQYTKKQVVTEKPRFKTDFEEEEKLATSKIEEISLRTSKNRARTEIKHQQSAKHAISVQNESLKKQLLTEEDEADFKHIDLPTRFNMLRHKGNKFESLMDSKKKGMSLHSRGEKSNDDMRGKELPNIFNNKFASKQLLREIRKKLNF